jgi:hypothetical protein
MGTLLYQELLRTTPWDFILALSVILIVLSVPMTVAIGTWVQSRRSAEEREIPWLTERAQTAAEERERATPPQRAPDRQHRPR